MRSYRGEGRGHVKTSAKYEAIHRGGERSCKDKCNIIMRSYIGDGRDHVKTSAILLWGHTEGRGEIM